MRRPSHGDFREHAGGAASANRMPFVWKIRHKNTHRWSDLLDSAQSARRVKERNAVRRALEMACNAPRGNEFSRGGGPRSRDTRHRNNGRMGIVERLPSQQRNGIMLVLSRKKNESIVINDDITIVVVEIRGDKVRLGVEAPKEVPVHRREVYDAIKRSEMAKDSDTP